MYPSIVLGKVTVYDSTYSIGFAVGTEALPQSTLVLTSTTDALVVLVVSVPVLCKSERMAFMLVSKPFLKDNIYIIS